VEHLEARELLSTYSLWSPTATPINTSEPDSNSVEVGVQFKSDVAGTISGIRFYKGAGNTGTHVGQLFSSTGQLLASATFSGETASGWQQVNFSTPIAITANTTYVAAYHTNFGHYADDQGYFALSALNSGPLHATEGVYKYGRTGSFPNQTFNNSNYWVDLVFNGATTSTPPVANAGPAKSTNEGGSVTFAGSETGGTGALTYSWTFGDGTTGTGSLTPSHVYANHGSYTATLTVTDSSGKTSSASTTVTVNDVAPTANAGGPYSGTAGTLISFKGSATDPGANDAAGLTYLWDFGDNTTSTQQNPTHSYANAGTYNVKLTVTETSGLSSTAATTASVSAVATTTSLFANSVTPSNPAENDPNAVEVGVQFTSSVPGFINGIRFYKGTGNTGTHVGNLWSSTGQLLATATFTNESATGWQTVTFNTPVAIQANTTYVASYFTSTGFYADDQGVFATPLTSGSLTGLQGVYNYGSSSIFPNQTFNNSNYYVDVVFNPTVTGSAPVANAGPAKSTNEGGSVTFAGSETGGTGPFTYAWNFGDGTTGTGSLTPTHTYANHGAYTATLTVTDAFGRSSSSNVAVTVNDVAPTADAGGPYSGVPGVAVTFNGSATDPGANDVSGCTYLWTFGDGTTSTLENPTHVYAAVGTYTATFKVTEASGLSSTASATVTITAASLPVANAGPAKSTNEGGSVTFAGSETGGTGPFTYAWNFGDGTTGTGSLTPTHTYNAPGSFTATLTVTDALNHTSTNSTTVTVNAVAPTVNSGGPYSGTPGAAVSFAGSATAPNPGDLTNATYTWSFGDGTTASGQNASHSYATAGTYTVTLTVKEASGLSATATTTANVASASLAPQYIQTSTNKIPNFGFKPTVVSVKSGNWSDPTVWSTGKLPGAGDVVDIMPGMTVTYDVNSTVHLNTIAIQASASLKFRTDVNTMVYVGNFEVLPGGYLEMGTQANPVQANVMTQVFIANQAINTTLDPEQFGTGLIVLGKMSSFGAAKTPYVTLSQEPHAGDTVLHFASAVSGWRVGDILELPDTRQLFDTTRGKSYVPQYEQLVIKSISADGLSVTLTAPLKFDHLGARDAKGTLDFLAQVTNVTRNVMVASEDVAAGVSDTRGYTLFTSRADVNIQNTGFCELGRTTSNPEDDTTFDSNGNVTHIGTNEGDRAPMTVLNLFGPTSPQANGYQFTLAGNVITANCVVCTNGTTNLGQDSPYLWGLVVNNSFYGLIQNNVVYNTAGVGIGVEDGASSYNVFDHNFVMRVNGTGARLDKQFQGDGFWFQNPNNHVTNNIATDINNDAWDASASYSYGFDVDAKYVGTVNVAAYQGADPTKPGQSVAVNMNGTPLLEFANNELYASPRGLTLWWLGTSFETVMGNAGTVKNMVVWNQSTYALFNYETNNLVLDGFVVRGDESQLNNQYLAATGLFFADYMTRNCIITNADIQGEATGIVAPQEVGRDSTTVPFTIQNSFLDNEWNIDIPVIASSNGGGGLSGRKTIIQNVTFAYPPNSLPGTANIVMDHTMNYDPSFYNLSAPDIVDVYNYNGIVNNNFQVVYDPSNPSGMSTTAAGVIGKTVAI
jgi:PKD repeat protein